MEREGVVKYRLDYAYAPAEDFPGFSHLNAWRTILYRLGLIGQDPARYGGLGYGNLSQRLTDMEPAMSVSLTPAQSCRAILPGPQVGASRANPLPADWSQRERGNKVAATFTLKGETFVITATQTGHLPHLEAQHYVRVLWASPADNALRAQGPAPPSSEALTHAALYTADARIRYVIHVHCPEIWREAERLRLPMTAAECAYGTPELAGEVGRMAAASGLPGLLVMGGHEDGILVFGAELSPTAGLLIDTLAEALT